MSEIGRSMPRHLFYREAVMSTRGLYVMWDKLAERRGPVFESENDETARRSAWKLLRRVPRYDWDSFELWRIALVDVDKKDINVSYENIDINIPRLDKLAKDGELFSEDEIVNMRDSGA